MEYIVDKEKSEILNIRNVSSIFIDSEIIYALLVSGSKRVLGNYGSEVRAQEVFK